MITFSQFLIESRSAPLYHATYLDNLPDIEKQGIKPKTMHHIVKTKGISNYTIKDDDGDLEYAKGVSLTRRLEFARSWAPIVLELDQRKLAHRYKIIPFQYFQHMGTARVRPGKNEFEEFVLTTKAIPFSYVNRIIVDTKRHEVEDSSILGKIREKYGSSFITTFD